MNTGSNRREFLKVTAGTGAVVALGESLSADETQTQWVSKSETSTPLKTVRVGFVGVGRKGSAHLGSLLHMPGVEVRAVCDVVEQQCVEAQEQAVRLGHDKPTAYFRGERDFERMCQEEELDLVYTATPWRWHAPVCLAAMKNGSHAATEIPGAVTLDECWQLVETSETTGRHCCMMENVNYQRNEMAIWNMIRKGVIGDIVYGEAGYMHDTRYLKASDVGDGLWLGDHHATRNGCLYPMHGLGPLSWYMDINRGDRLEYLVSMSSPARGLREYMDDHLPKGHPKRERDYLNGDVNVCLIKTVSGRTMTIKHDTDLPRPYSRRNLVQGTGGIIRGFPDFEVCLDGPNRSHKWTSGDDYLKEYEHPLWQDLLERSDKIAKRRSDGAITKGGVWTYAPERQTRGGDFLEDERLILALQQGIAPDYDVYDAATWSVIAPLSEQSVANRSTAVDIPDFTRGKWKINAPLQIGGV